MFLAFLAVSAPDLNDINGKTKSRWNRAETARNAKNISQTKQADKVASFDVFYLTKSYNISLTQLTRELRACPNPTVEVWVI